MILIKEPTDTCMYMYTNCHHVCVCQRLMIHLSSDVLGVLYCCDEILMNYDCHEI